jgi:hypothetical protein
LSPEQTGGRIVVMRQVQKKMIKGKHCLESAQYTTLRNLRMSFWLLEKRSIQSNKKNLLLRIYRRRNNY